jgi:hypothetical protein
VLRSVDVTGLHLSRYGIEDANEVVRASFRRVLDRFEDKHGPNVLVDAG